jgi:hypothetical protein
MRLKLPVHLLYFLPLLLFACAPQAPAVLAQEPATGAAADFEPVAATEAPIEPPTPTGPASAEELQQRAPIILSISVYIVDESSGELSSGRSAGELETIFDRANEIWAPAGITLEVQTIQRIILPSEVVQAISEGDFSPFFDGAGRDFAIPEPSVINAFYGREIGGPNGIVPFGSRLFFVADEPSVHHERVTSHEIGHILGLHHTLEDEGRLMFPGTNGMNLTEEEIVVARYVVQGMLDRVR